MATITVARTLKTATWYQAYLQTTATDEYVSVTEGSGLSSMPGLPLLPSHKLSTWPPCSAVLTGGMYNDLGLIQALQMNVICLICL